MVNDLSEWHMVFFDSDWAEIPHLTQTVFGWKAVMKIMQQWRHCQFYHRGLSHVPYVSNGTHDCLANVYAVDIANTFDPRKESVICPIK